MTQVQLMVPTPETLLNSLRYRISTYGIERDNTDGMGETTYRSDKLTVIYSSEPCERYTITLNCGVLVRNKQFYLYSYRDKQRSKQVTMLRRVKRNNNIESTNTELAALNNALFHHC